METPDTTTPVFADYLRQVMAAHGLTSVADLVRLLEVDQPTVARWLNGQHSRPSLKHLRGIAERLDVPLPILIVEAGLATATEMAIRPARSAALPPEIRAILQLINDPNIPDRYKRILLKGVSQARLFFLEMFQAPREPAMRSKKTAVDRP